MARNKMFFHNVNTSWKTMLQTLDNAGVPGAVKSLTAGPIAEAAAIKAASGVDHTIIYRITKPGVPTAPDDVPDYKLPPSEAAVKSAFQYQQTLNQSPELNDIYHLFKLECGNELRTKYDHDDPNWNNMHPVDWLGQWALAFCQEMTAWRAEIRIAMFGMNAGTPEAIDWLRPGMADFLALCSESDGKYSVSLHEGIIFGDPDAPINREHPSWGSIIGRFIGLDSACAALNIMTPDIYITEWAYRNAGNLPNLDKVRTDIQWLNEMVYPHPAVKDIFLWDWSNNNQPLAGDVGQLVPWITQYSIDAYEPDPDPPPEPPGETFEAHMWQVHLDNHIMDLNADAALQKAIFEDSVVPVSKEWRAEYDGVAYAGQGAESLDGSKLPRVYYTEVGNWNNVRWLNQPGVEPEPLPDPLEGLVLSVPLDAPWTIVPGGQFDAPRNYANGKHEGLDFATAYHNANVLAPMDGIVDLVAVSNVPGGGYGQYVRMTAFYQGREVRLWLAHLDIGSPTVAAGDIVTRGQPVGNVGSSGNSTGVHVHLTLAAPGIGMADYAVADVVDPTKYVDFNVAPPPPAPLPKLDMLPYLMGEGVAYMVQHPGGGQEKLRTWPVGDGRWYQLKNSQYEELWADDAYIWRGLDTSPGPAPPYSDRPGQLRYYRQFEPGKMGARWTKRFMAIGETFVGFGHMVQFRFKVDCAPDPANSGPATNVTTLVARHDSLTFNGLTIHDVIEIGGGPERFFFARGFGLVAWASEWGQSAIASILPENEWDNQPEVIPCL